MPDYLKTWRSINQAGGPTEPVRSHFLQPQAKISPNKGLNRIDTPIPEDEPLADLNLNSFIRNRVPGANTAMDFLSDPSNLETGGANNAISWFGTKAAREASGDNLIKILRSRHAEGTPMREAVEKAYTNYPRTFAHISDIDNTVGKRSHRGTHFPEWGADQKFLDVPIHDEFGDPAGTVPKLKTTRQSTLADTGAVENYIKSPELMDSTRNPRTLAINNRVAIRPDIIGTPQGEVTFRHELGHVAQNIRDPKGHINTIEAGRGQIKGIHDSGTDLSSLDYMLEPIEVGARYGQERGLDKATKVTRNLSPEQIEALGPTAAWPTTRVRPVKKHADIINSELDRVINDFKIKTGYAKDTPLYQENYGYSGPGKGKKVYPSKGDLAKSEPKVLAAAFAKIQNQVLPHFNKARPANDPLVFTLNGTVIPKIEGMLKNPEKLGDFIRNIRVQRLSQVK